MLVSISAALAQQEFDRRSERVKAGMEQFSAYELYFTGDIAAYGQSARR